ncbi:MAG TPA: hypothetical protein PLP34_10200, partial [Chitinophagaceae bacterium]|nr:hypothetical protein [Chitinophagaceae bacterium]
WLQQNKVQINQAANEVVQATLTEDGKSYQLILKRNDDRSFDTSCTCRESRYALCKHKVALFLQLLNHFGATYFDSIRNWDTQKNKLLALYGYSLQDDLKGKFEFTEVDGKPILKVLDSSIKKIGQATPEWKAPLHQEPVTTFRGKKLGIVINLKETEFPYFSVELIQGEASEDDPDINGTIEVLDLNKIPGNEDFTPIERELLSLVRKMQKSEIARFIARNSPFGDLWENIHDHHTEWNTENAGLLFEYLHPKLLRLFALQRNQHPVYLFPAGKAFKSGSLIKTAYADHSLQPYIEVKKLKSKGFAKVHLFTERHGTRWTLRSNRLKNPLLFLFDQELVLIHKPADALRLFEWGDDRIIKASEWEDVLNQKLLPLCRFYDIQFDQELVENRYEADPLLKIYLSEQGSYFILKPVFVYGSTEASWNEEASVSSLEDGKLVIIHRNKTKEETY